MVILRLEQNYLGCGGWDGTMLVVVLRLGCDYLGGSIKAGVRQF